MSSEWIANQWKRSELGDKRLTKRAIKIGEACLKTPYGSLPKKFGGWRGTKAAYRFFDSDGVSHEALQKVHNENVLEMAAKSEQMVLFIQDGSESVTYVRAFDPEDSDLEWILVTSLKVNSAEDALTVVYIYEQRWIIEEYHKCLKTGCRIEDVQLKKGKRLLALFGILGVIATQLLQLRDISRHQPDMPAEEVVAKDIITIVKSKYKLMGVITVKELWRRVAMMGGFLGRKSDGNPGWQTIWKGWLRIQDILEGMALVKSCG